MEEKEVKRIVRPSRAFAGKTEGFESKEEKKFQQAALKAYLAGRKWFNFGFYTDEIGNRHRGQFITPQKNYPVDHTKQESRAAKRLLQLGKAWEI